MKELKDLQVGDEVIVDNYLFLDVFKVERITKAFIVVNGNKFRKSNGKSFGNFMCSEIVLAPKEVMEEIKNENKRLRLANKVSSFNFRSLPIEKLEILYNILRENK